MSAPLIYTKPLTLEERLLIDTVTMRYPGIGESWVAFDRGDHIELRCPDIIRRVWSAKDLQTEAVGVHGIPDRARAING